MVQKAFTNHIPLNTNEGSPNLEIPIYKVVTAKDFLQKENGAVIMSDEARKTFIKSWQERKQEKITHPFLGEKISWGLVPHVQALLLARYLRGDLDEYPPFMWK